jgi:hypothetical protein
MCLRARHTVSLTIEEWLRHIAITSGEAKLGERFPRRKLISPSSRKKGALNMAHKESTQEGDRRRGFEA